jgi:hypothetical protein
MLVGFLLSAYAVRERKKLHETKEIVTAIPMKLHADTIRKNKEMQEQSQPEESDSFLQRRESGRESPEDGWQQHI